MYVDIKYLNLLSTRLPLCKRKDDYLWNFRCPICGDSQKSKTKARGFIFRVKGKLLYKCHNCGISMPFDKLLERLDGALYSEYRLEKFQETQRPNPHKLVQKKVAGTPEFKVDILASLTPIEQLNNSHPAREYLLNRRLPLDGLYWTDKFKEWTNSVKPGTFDDTRMDEGRIIIPFRNEQGVTFGYQGRQLGSTGIRYITILLKEDAPKIFGLNTVNYDKPVYITEGPFDSLLLENAIAMAGADASHRSLGRGSHIWVYDNEPRNKQITSRIAKHIAAGDSVVIWPSHIKQKDINDMVLAEIPVQNIITSNTFSGLTAQIKFNTWKK